MLAQIVSMRSLRRTKTDTKIVYMIARCNFITKYITIITESYVLRQSIVGIWLLELKQS